MPQATTQGGAVQVPRTEVELRAVSLHRNELTSQLQQLSEQRNALIGERYQAVANQAPPSVVAELDARIKTLGDRAVRIEREKLATDDVISQALARGVETADAVAPAPYELAGGQELIAQSVAAARDAARVEYQRIALVSGTGFVLLAVLAWRWAWSRASARLRRELATAQPTGGMRELKDAVDAIAVEVERISENQRFVTKLLSEHEGMRIPARDATRDERA